MDDEFLDVKAACRFIGGTKPIKKFDDSPDSPYTCSVDPTNGNLAVANNDGTSTQGNIAIWNAATAILKGIVVGPLIAYLAVANVFIFLNLRYETPVRS